MTSGLVAYGRGSNPRWGNKRLVRYDSIHTELFFFSVEKVRPPLESLKRQKNGSTQKQASSPYGMADNYFVNIFIVHYYQEPGNLNL